MLGSLIASDLDEKLRMNRGQQFTGLVKVNGQHGPHQARHQWVIYYLLGQIVWTKSRVHSLRRWQRHLAAYSPAFYEQLTPPTRLSYESWNYASLARLVMRQQFPADQFYKIVESCIAEDLFDILQVGSVQQARFAQGFTYEAHSQAPTGFPFLKLQQGLAWQRAQQMWMAWEQAGLAQLSPDWAPVITQLETLREQSPPRTFKTLTTFVDGKTTLRELAGQFKQPLIPLTKSILTYVSRKMLGLIEVPDLVINASDGFDAEPLQTGMRRSQSKTPARNPQPAPRIIYIDDSPSDSREMHKIVEALGYQYRNISDPLQALPLLIEYKPKLIFLDLVMPIANGYEVCAQIRRITSFKEVPIIIVTSNDGIADRVRARLVGASGFLGKPIQAKKVARVLTKHLRPVEVSVPGSK
jgi:chemotaxis family two-component system response regulator PixG